MNKVQLEMKLFKMAAEDYEALVTQQNCSDPGEIGGQIELCRKRRREGECDHNFVILRLGTIGAEIGRYQFTLNKNGKILAMKRLYAQLFKQ
jgi:hypothetical protein